ncbi:hypothetical protein K435DRAFT_725860 [Dendrothele bispora CBS 962.96]|nr:hypothetical protein K435DRAFT_725860 [Dendrothele bispora CBS 962.96]
MNINVAPNGQFMFSPNNITAPVGTLVTFWFPTLNNGPHSVTQSSFADPCTFLQANSSSNAPAGFDSGLQSATTFTINVTDDQPIWFHCKQILHCGMGMVGSINAPTNGTNTFQAFLSAASAIGSNEKTETDNGPVISGVHGVAVSSPTPSAPSGSGSGSSGALTLSASTSLSIVLGIVAGGAMIFA